MSRFSLKLSNSSQLLNHFSSCKPSHLKQSIQLSKIGVHACIFHKYLRLTLFVMSAELANTSNCNTIWINYSTVYSFLSRFGPFLRSEMKFSKLLVQPPHNLITCAHHKSNFSFFWTNCNCFGTFMQLIMCICLRSPTFSVANIMLLKMYYIVCCAIVLALKTSSH